jgi:hypothetical protein
MADVINAPAKIGPKLMTSLPNLFSKENIMDPSDVLGHLLVLTQVEEMLIARVHMFLKVGQIRG